MKTILIFDQAESAGGSINRAVDLAENLGEFNFIFLTFHSLEKLNSATNSAHISSKRIFSFYNGRKAYLHAQWAEKNFKSAFIIKVIKNLIGLVGQINKISTLIQAIFLIYFKKINLVQANCGFHPLPYLLSKIKKTKLIYYFRDLQNYSAINPAKINCATRYVFVGRNLMHEYQLQLKLPPAKCSMVHSPFDVTKRIQKEKNPDLSKILQLKNAGKKILILTSRICEDKGQHTALMAINELKKNYTDFVLLIVGGADPDSISQAYYKNLKTYINDHHLDDYVLFLGHRKDALHLTKNADIAIQTATYFEAIGGVLVESLQLGTPTIASAVGGTPEVIHDNETGFLFEAGDHAQLAKILLNLLTENVDTKKISLQGQKFACEEWNSKLIEAQMKNIYHDTIGNSISTQ